MNKNLKSFNKNGFERGIHFLLKLQFETFYQNKNEIIH